VGLDAFYCGNFRGFQQYRKTVSGENVKKFTGSW